MSEEKLPSDGWKPVEVKLPDISNVPDQEIEDAVKKIDDAKATANSAREYLGLVLGIAKKFILAILLALLFCAGCGCSRCALGAEDTDAPKLTQVKVAFSPNYGGADCTETICGEIKSAKKEILVQAYSFTSKDICQALIAAKKRGVEVLFLADKSDKTGKGERLNDLVDAGIPVKIDAKHAIAHNKVMVLDGAVVITGSFNFTESAEHKNAENCIVLHNPTLAKLYAANWQKHDAHSEVYEPDRAQVIELPEPATVVNSTRTEAVHDVSLRAPYFVSETASPSPPMKELPSDWQPVLGFKFRGDDGRAWKVCRVDHDGTIVCPDQ